MNIFQEKFNLFDKFIKQVNIDKDYNEDYIISYKKEVRKISSKLIGQQSVGISVKKLGDVRFFPLDYYMKPNQVKISVDCPMKIKFYSEYSTETKTTSNYISKFGFYKIDSNGDFKHSLEEFPSNIFEWTEEDFFYYKLKHC